MMQKPNNGYDNENSHQGLKSAYVVKWGKKSMHIITLQYEILHKI